MTTTPYFSHDVNAQRDDKCVRLLQTLGWKGYGVYWALIERLHEQKDCVLEYNPKGLAWSLHLPEKYLIRVITEFGLFTIAEDGQTFWSNSARRRRAYRSRQPKEEVTPETPKRKRGRPRKYPRPDEISTESKDPRRESDPEIAEPKETPKTASAALPEQSGLNTPDNKNETHKTTEKAAESVKADPDLSTIAQKQPNKPKTQHDPVVPVESIIASWNQIFSGTRQTHKGLFLDPLSYQRAKESLELGYSFDQIEEAFKIARSDSFGWLLKDVLKPDNVQRLLIKGEKANGTQHHSVLGNNAESTQQFSGDDWGDPSKWSQFEQQQN